MIATLHHMVSDSSPRHIRQIYQHKSILPFKSDLNYLQSNYKITSYEKTYRRGSSRTPELILTFDDGLGEHFDVIRPILIQRQLPAIFFITTDWIDNRKLGPRHQQSLFIDHWQRMNAETRQAAMGSIKAVLKNSSLTPVELPAFVDRKVRAFIELPWRELFGAIGRDEQKYLQENRPYLTRKQISQMASEGFTIGAHSRSHRKFSSIKDHGEWADEVVISCREIVEITGQHDVPFAFPHSGATVPISFMRRMQHEHDFVGQFFDTNGIAATPSVVTGRITLDSPHPINPQELGTAEQELNRAYSTEARRIIRRGVRWLTRLN